MSVPEFSVFCNRNFLIDYYATRRYTADMKTIWPKLWVAPHIALWRMIWFLLVQAARFAFIVLVAVQFGPASMQFRDVWRDLR